jgi:hypothetical protein
MLKRLSAIADRYIVYFNFVFLFAVLKIRKVRIRKVIISRLQEKIIRTLSREIITVLIWTSLIFTTANRNTKLKYTI